MPNRFNIFALESKVDQLFEVLFPKAPHGLGVHRSGRGYKPIIESSIGSLVPGGNESRLLQTNREYYKIEFQDFLDFATSANHPTPGISTYADQTAVFYEQLSLPQNDKREVHATWTSEGQKYGLSINDAAIARDRVFVTVLMRFTVLTLDNRNVPEGDKPAYGTAIGLGNGEYVECGATIQFAPESISKTDSQMGPLGEWERAMWWPSQPGDEEWRFVNSGEYTSTILEELESDKAQQSFSSASLTKLREQIGQTHSEFGVYFEIARLGLLLPRYVDFMYDLVVTEKREVGRHRLPKRPQRGNKKSKPVDKVIYKVINSIRVIRPASATKSDVYRQWVAPSYSFLVRGHWRKFPDPSQIGRDASGHPIVGKTWIRDFQKYKQKEFGEGLERGGDRNPAVVVGIKQTLAHAREILKTEDNTSCLQPNVVPPSTERPSREWVANERAKLTAALRYLVLRRDKFRCCLCGKNATDENFVKLEVDHRVPVSKWGKTEESNLHTVCRECNRGKSDRDD